uniref:Peptidase M13 N-terminal domain-containing protein n=1 Tax=Strongyloides stercoralis TaxID=6248 RepID=A0A0K0EGG9_STRER
MSKERLLTLLDKNGIPYSKIRPDLSSRNLNNVERGKYQLFSLSGFGRIVDIIIIILILLSLIYFFVYVRLIVYNKNWMNHHTQDLESEKIVYLKKLRNGLEHENLNNPGINICRRENYLKNCDDENIKWNNNMNTEKCYENYFNDKKNYKNNRIPYYKEIKMFYDKCISETITQNDILKKVSNFLNKMTLKYGEYFIINNTTKNIQDTLLSQSFLNLTKMIADMKIFFNIDLLIVSSIELDKNFGHEDGTSNIHSIFTIKDNGKIFHDEEEGIEKYKIFTNLKYVLNNKFNDDEYHQLANDIYNIENIIFKNRNNIKIISETVKLKDINGRWNILNIHSYINYISRFNRDLNRKLIDNEVDIFIENPQFFTLIDNLVIKNKQFQNFKNYILYKGVLSIIKYYNTTKDSFYCSNIIGEHLPLLNTRIINTEISFFDKDSMEILVQKYAYTSYNSIIELLNSFQNIDHDIVNKIKKIYDSMRILAGAPRWIFNDAEIYKYYGNLPIFEHQTFDEIVEGLNKFKNIKKLDGIIGNITVDEFLYSDGSKLSKNIYYCPSTNTIYLPSSLFLIMLKSFNDPKLSLNNVILSQFGYELGKVIIPYKNVLFNNVSDDNKNATNFYNNSIQKGNNKNESYCLNNIIYGNKKGFIKELDETIIEKVMRHMISIQSSYSIYNNYINIFQKDYFSFHNDVKNSKKLDDFYFYYEIKEYLCIIEDSNIRDIIIDLLSLMHSFQVSRDCHSQFNIPTCLNWLSLKWFKFPTN